MLTVCRETSYLTLKGYSCLITIRTSDLLYTFNNTTANKYLTAGLYEDDPVINIF